MSEIIDSRIPLDAFWGAEARYLADCAGQASTARGIAERLEKALIRRATNLAPPDGAMHSIFQLIKGSHGSEGQMMDQLIDQLGLSERTLRRRCHEGFGYGPKTLHRILRFQRFLRLANVANCDAIASLALDAGYADQAHLTREASRLAGLTPRSILKQVERGRVSGATG
jgi:AraC-like DNA-binding protein